MNHTIKRALSLCFLLLCALVSLLAAPNPGDEAGSQIVSKRYKIAHYQINDPKGKTQTWAVLRLIQPSGDEIFPTERELTQALNDKVQILRNERLWDNISYTWYVSDSTSDTNLVDVTFRMEDNRSWLFLPYGKYDSNYGIKGGIRFYDKNLFGQLAYFYLDFSFKQYDNSFSDGEYMATLKLNNLRITRNVEMDLLADYELNKHKPKDSYFTFNINTRGIKVDNKNLDLGEWLTIKPKADEDGLYDNNGTWDFTAIGNTFTFGPFAENIGGFVWWTWFNYNPSTTTLYERINTNQTLTYDGFKLFGRTVPVWLGLWTMGDDDGTLHKTRVSLGASYWIPFKIFGIDFGWYNSLQFVNTLYPRDSSYIEWYQPSDEDHLLYEPSFCFSTTVSHNNINYYDDDFRRGWSVEFTYTNELYMGSEFQGIKYRDYNYEWFNLRLTGYFNAGWFNPSFRFIGTINDYGLPKYDNPVLDNARHFNPGGDSDFSTYMRGIPDDNEYAMDYEEPDGDTVYDVRYGAVLNLNFMMQFIRLGNFAHTIINPFIDIGVIRKEPSYLDEYASEYQDDVSQWLGDAQWLVSAGIEGIGIIDSHPSYPIRLSIGINMGDIYHKIKGDIGEETPHNSVEYEITLGLYHFFDQ